MSDFTSTRQSKARKIYQCEGCRRTIEIGDTYTRYSGVWEGDFSTFQMHPECAALETRMMTERDCEPDDWYGLLEEIMELPEDHADRVLFNRIRDSKRVWAEAKKSKETNNDN